MTSSKTRSCVMTGIVVVALFVSLTAPAKAIMAVNFWEQVSNLVQVRTYLDDLFTDAWQQQDCLQAAEQKLNTDYQLGKQRLDAAFGAQKLLICNFPGLGSDQRAQCINKLNESYQARLSELRRRIDAERSRAACYQF